MANLVAQLVGAGVATPLANPGNLDSRRRAASIRVHGRGPLSDLLVQALRCSGARIRHSSQPHAAVTPAGVDLVVLSDYLVAIRTWCAICTPREFRIFPFGFVTAPGWSGPWWSPA